MIAPEIDYGGTRLWRSRRLRDRTGGLSRAGPVNMPEVGGSCSLSPTRPDAEAVD